MIKTLPNYQTGILALAVTHLLLSSCGSPQMITLPSLAANQPRVIAVEPNEGAAVNSDAFVVVHFSRAIEPLSINRYSFLVVENFEPSVPETISENLEDGELVGIDGQYTVSEDGMLAAFVPLDIFRPRVRYGVIVTRDVFTIDHFSLNQTPSSQPTPFVSTFIVNDGADEAGTSFATSAGQNQGSGGEFDNDVDAPAGGEEAADDAVAATPLSSSPSPSPEFVVINELYYDAVGIDTNGNLFVELYGTVGGDIAGYKLVFVNGDDGRITESITIPNGVVIPDNGLYIVADAITGAAGITNVVGADYITNFDPQNGPDAVQFLDNENNLLDAVCYGVVLVRTAENGLAMCEGETAPDAPSGQSITRNAGTDSDNNAADFSINTAPLAGML